MVKRLIGLTIVATAALGFGPATGAYAWGPAAPPGSPPGRSKPPRGGSPITGTPRVGTTVDRTVGNCSVISTSSFLGVNCGHVHGGGKKTIKKILKGDPLPQCWNEPMSAGQKHSLGLQDTPGSTGQTWYWVKCLSGINPKTLKVEPGGVKISWGYMPYPNDPKPGQPRVIYLTIHQKALVDMEEKDGTIPVPVAGVSPSPVPLVNQRVAFFDGTDSQVLVSVDQIRLRGHVTRLTVHPTGDGGTTCGGAGVKVHRSDTPKTKPNACWYTFDQSSADQPDHRFAGDITARWSIDMSTDGGKTWSHLNTFDKIGQTTVEVKEVQSVVVG